MMNKLLPQHTVQSNLWQKGLSLPLALALFLSPLLGFQATPVSADGWVIECVDCPKQFDNMTNRSLRLDAEGHPHIAYGGDGLYYAWHDGADWHYETVPDAGQYTSLALDRGGYPHISYVNSHKLKYAYKDASGWHIETVDVADVTYTSLALDRNGYPHISYYIRPGRFEADAFLKYAYRDASGWHIEIVTNQGSRYHSLTLDKDGYPHISYFNKYAYKNASGWHIETVGEGECGGWEFGYSYNSLALDHNGYPHISSSGPEGLTYVHKDASGWHIETVDSDCDNDISMALDRNGYPHITCYTGYTGHPNTCLKYAYRNASGWHIHTVDSGGVIYWFTSLDVDGNGYPHLSYYYCPWHPSRHEQMHICDLKYARQDAAGWLIETVDVSVGQVGAGTSLALDGSGYPHISYIDYTNSYLKYAYQDASGWHVETLDSDGLVGEYTSLALDMSGYPHISYYDRSNHVLAYIYQDGSGWHIQTVDSEFAVGEYSSLALDKDGYPHISYYGNGALKYAYWDVSGWHIETVDSEGGSFTSLVLDGDGYPHISYYTGAPHIAGDLKYAYQDASGWHIEIVESEFASGGYTSLALDDSRYPHISYRGHGAVVKYAYKDASGWYMETVDSSEFGVACQYTSLALDRDGYPHISYLGPTGRGTAVLKYAYKNASGWHIETVNGSGVYTSLALDKGSNPHISYGTGDLKYAYSISWLDWRDPDRPLLLPPRGATVGVVYGNIRTSATLTATLTGPAIFADASQLLTANITDVNGSHALQLKPAEGATPGDTFTLGVTLAGLQLEQVGAIAWEVYLPLIVKAYELDRLTYAPANDFQPALSPDGQTVVFVSDREGQTDVFSIPLMSLQITNLTQTPVQEDTPVFSPDGSAIAFASDRDGDWSIYLMNPDGTNVRPALDGDAGTDELHPSFTPDGLGLVFSSNRADGNWDIYTATIGSSQWTRLTTHPAVDRFPTVSADGRTIAFRSERDGNSEVYLMDADGSNLRRVTDDPAFDGYPSMIPDGSGVVFVSNRSGKWNVYVADLTGGGLTALEQREDWEMNFPRLSDDGRWLVYAGGRIGSTLDIYLREFVNPLK